MNPFHIDGPAVISFSGGRTSAYMLRRILDVGLQPDVHVVFADTGKERVETYDFVAACSREWDIHIEWVHRPGYFDQLIVDREGVPNPRTRFCTQELKIRPMRDFMLAQGHKHWTNVVGLRADEPGRVARMRKNAQKKPERWDIDLPLVDAGITVSDVNAFWNDRPALDLQLKPHEGNCDLCFLKSRWKIKNLARDRPDLAVWWAEKEEQVNSLFRIDRPSYRQFMSQLDLFEDMPDDDDLIECFCTD